MASLQSNTYPSRGTLHFAKPFATPVHSEALLDHQLAWQSAQERSETETCWIFSVRTSLPKEKGISSTFHLKAVIFVLFFLKRLLTGLSLSCTILTNAYLSLPTPIHVHMTLWERGLCSLPGLGQTLAVVQYKWTTEESAQLQALSFDCKVFPLFSVSGYSF